MCGGCALARPRRPSQNGTERRNGHQRENQHASQSGSSREIDASKGEAEKVGREAQPSDTPCLCRETRKVK